MAYEEAVIPLGRVIGVISKLREPEENALGDVLVVVLNERMGRSYLARYGGKPVGLSRSTRRGIHRTKWH